MNVAKWLFGAVLLLPVMELVAFIAVAAAIGFLSAVTLLVAASLMGLLILRHAGGNHVSRIRATLGRTNFTAVQADDAGSLTLLSGILLLIPGFISGILGLILLAAPVRRVLAAMLGRGKKSDGSSVVDLPPEQWHRVPDPELPDRREDRAT